METKELKSLPLTEEYSESDSILLITDTGAKRIQASTFKQDSGGNVDLTGYATEQFVRDGYQPKGNYLTEHQDISGKLDANKLPEAINDALAQAKESGEFDGADGKSAYQYAKEGGYTGTEAEFSAMLASEGYGYVAQPEPPADTNLLWLDTDDESADASGAQADWNAPEGQPGHILNRTHYDYIAKVVEEITINASSRDTTFTAASPIVIGETYSIHWGDEIYVCEAVDGAVMAPEGAGYPVLGNYGNLIGGTDTGEPFVIMVMGTGGSVIGFGENIEITFSIDGQTAKKISEKYLPAFVKSYTIPVNSFDGKLAKITLDTTELAEAIKNNYPIYIEKIAGYNADRYMINRVNIVITPESGAINMVQSIDWLIAMGVSISNLPIQLFFNDGLGSNYSVYINNTEE